MTMLNRVRRMELASPPTGRMHWLSPSEPGQTLAEATAAYETVHGPIGKADVVVHWDEFSKLGS